MACWPPGPEERLARSSTSPSGIESRSSILSRSGIGESISAASSKSASVRPPSEWVEMVTVTLSQEISRSGWWPIDSAGSTMLGDEVGRADEVAALVDPADRVARALPFGQAAPAAPRSRRRSAGPSATMLPRQRSGRNERLPPHPLAHRDLALQREGALGARLQGRRAQAPGAASRRPHAGRPLADPRRAEDLPDPLSSTAATIGDSTAIIAALERALSRPAPLPGRPRAAPPRPRAGGVLRRGARPARAPPRLPRDAARTRSACGADRRRDGAGPAARSAADRRLRPRLHQPALEVGRRGGGRGRPRQDRRRLRPHRGGARLAASTWSARPSASPTSPPPRCSTRSSPPTRGRRARRGSRRG